MKPIFKLMASLYCIMLCSSPIFAAKQKPLPDNEVIFKIDVLKNGKKIKTEKVTAAGLRNTYRNIQDTVQKYGPISEAEWKRQVYNMTAVQRCGFLLETFAALQAIKEGVFDATPAVEMTATNLFVALNTVNEATGVECNKAP